MEGAGHRIEQGEEMELHLELEVETVGQKTDQRDGVDHWGEEVDPQEQEGVEEEGAGQHHHHHQVAEAEVEEVGHHALL